MSQSEFKILHCHILEVYDLISQEYLVNKCKDFYLFS